MKQSGHVNHSEETGTGCPVTSKYGRKPPNNHGGMGRQQHNSVFLEKKNIVYLICMNWKN